MSCENRTTTENKKLKKKVWLKRGVRKESGLVVTH